MAGGTEQGGGRREVPRRAAEVTVCADGPLLLRGDFTIVAQDGTPVDAGRSTVALCRCGRSARRPFCDGTHKLVGFTAPGTREGGEPAGPG
ncbi:hypothetical protein GCM10010124_16520 [Pilimelia terevasa]|uniref:Iron-binding zinc finger CDGSH type domain-containing protein n=1 Tax=Pilimelia terevasa TaxID=53372 RepID=A0A8J3FJP6_9ACTN|nr:CDGSH iron-sulfur domain-containing protein [Pilimelia terevasa]GGK24684.1 hypothetical protein GCM10010124_16520 [Pilimelia terevasa]